MVNPEIEKLAPFVRRAGIALTGRERLSRMSRKLAFVWLTEDLSANSLREVEGTFRCPVVTAGTSADLDRLFGFPSTKILGFRQSSLADRILNLLRESGAPCRDGSSPGAQTGR